MKAWIFQAHRAKQALGDKAPWSCAWYSTDGKKKSKLIGCKSLAEKFARKVEGTLALGDDAHDNKATWEAFRKDYEKRILPGMAAGSQRITLDALKSYERLMKPTRMTGITTTSVDEFIAKRRLERGKQVDSKMSPASINKELRHLRAAFRVAAEWGRLRTVPKFRFVKEHEKLIRFVTPEHFAAIYTECEHATMPEGLPYPAADWWRGLLTFAYMTGWRIGEILAVRRDDVDLDKATALTRAENNKGKRDDLTPLHPVVVEHLRKMPGFSASMFPWADDATALYDEFHRLQALAGVGVTYGFHDLRRAFATLNADRLTGDALQALMRHKSYKTTQRYINVARQLNRAVEGLAVPAVLRALG